jgi:hypothetical protein
MHSPRLAGVLGSSVHRLQLLDCPGQPPIPPSGSKVSHPYPTSAENPPSGGPLKKHEARHAEPDGPEPAATPGETTQQTCPLPQSLVRMQATDTGEGQSWPVGTHVLHDGQHTSGSGHGVVVQSAPVPQVSIPSPPPSFDPSAALLPSPVLPEASGEGLWSSPAKASTAPSLTRMGATPFV